MLQEDLIESLERDGFGHYLAGLIDGEGTFLIRRGHHRDSAPRMRVKLRDDDAAILFECQRRTGLGNVYAENKASPSCSSNSKPQMVWDVQRRADLPKLVLILQCFPLRAKKRRDFEIWRLAVSVWLTKPRYGHWETMEALRRELMAERAYDEADDDSNLAPVLQLQPRLEGMS